MARPKKLDSEAMVNIVNDYYESCGDADLLKYSLLEAYASSLGLNVKAYDFRRDTDVRGRINELRDLSVLVSEDGVIAYKNLDIEAIIGRSRNLQTLKGELLELDETWRRVFDRALAVNQKNKSLAHENREMALRCVSLECEIERHIEQMSRLKGENKALSQANAYLRKMVRSYLYPAIANEILKSENVLEHVDTEAMPEAMIVLADAELPSPLTKTVANDRVFASREESLLLRMKTQAQGGNDA